MTSKKTLRRQIRFLRQSLTVSQQKNAMMHLARRLQALPVIKQSAHIGTYIANDGELNPFAFYHSLRQQKSFYIPKIGKHRKMVFNRLRPRIGILNNQYGITEISRGKIRSLKQMDVILLPLVAFDDSGARLGMGGGFYDKALAFRRASLWRRQPFLIGVAYSFQQVAHIDTDPWDVPLDMVVTDKATLYFRR